MLFGQAQFAEDLSPEEQDRYATAHSAARAYAHSLERRYLAHQRTPDMLSELRLFYRLPLDSKLNHIARAA